MNDDQMTAVAYEVGRALADWLQDNTSTLAAALIQPTVLPPGSHLLLTTDDGTEVGASVALALVPTNLIGVATQVMTSAGHWIRLGPDCRLVIGP